MKLSEVTLKNDLYSKVNAAALKQFGEDGILTCDEKQMSKLIDLKAADKIALDRYGEFGFATLDDDEARELINDNPKLVLIK